MYVLDYDYSSEESEVHVLSAQETDIWHRRMGHCGPQATNALRRQGIINSRLMGGTCKCHSCVAAKSTRKSVPKERHRATGVLDEVHMDTFVFGKPTLGGNSYLVMFTDAYSGYTCGYLQRTKTGNETLESFKTFKGVVETQTGCKLKRLQGDNGTEFINEKFETFCREHRILRTCWNRHEGLS